MLCKVNNYIHYSLDYSYNSFTIRDELFQATMVVEGSTLTEVHRDPNDPSRVTTITRHVDGNTMNVVGLTLEV